MITSPSRVSPKLSAASFAAVLSLAGLSLPLSPIFAQTSTTPPGATPAEAAPDAPEPPPAPRPKAPRAGVAQAAPVPAPAPAPQTDEAQILAGLRAQGAMTVAPGVSQAQALPNNPYSTQAPGASSYAPADPSDTTRAANSDAASARRKAQLQRAQVDVKRLSAELEAATRRLKDLEQSTQAADMGKKAAGEGKRAAEMGKRMAEQAKRAAEADKRAAEKWKMDQMKMWKSGDITPDQPGAAPGEGSFGPVNVHPMPGIGVHGNQYKEVTIRADGMPQIEVRELPGVSAGRATVGQPLAAPAPAPRDGAANRSDELERKLARLDRQIAELSSQVAALRGDMQRQNAGPTKPPAP